MEENNQTNNNSNMGTKEELEKIQADLSELLNTVKKNNDAFEKDMGAGMEKMEEDMDKIDGGIESLISEEEKEMEKDIAEVDELVKALDDDFS